MTTEGQIVAWGTLPLGSHTTAPQCPKCHAQEIQVLWHATVVLKHPDPYPCSQWPVEETPEHLCMTCWRCRYSWATRTADAECGE